MDVMTAGLLAKQHADYFTRAFCAGVRQLDDRGQDAFLQSWKKDPDAMVSQVMKGKEDDLKRIGVGWNDIYRGLEVASIECELRQLKTDKPTPAKATARGRGRGMIEAAAQVAQHASGTAEAAAVGDIFTLATKALQVSMTVSRGLKAGAISPQEALEKGPCGAVSHIASMKKDPTPAPVAAQIGNESGTGYGQGFSFRPSR